MKESRSSHVVHIADTAAGVLHVHVLEADRAADILAQLQSNCIKMESNMDQNAIMP